VIARILVRGSNDIGSAVAYALFSAGYAVVIHDLPQPTVTRRKMAFTDAIFENCTVLDGIEAQLVKQNNLLLDFLSQHKIIPVSTEQFEQVSKTINPSVVVDARMCKHHHPKTLLGLAHLTIGLGPNFVAGVTADLAIETSWGDQLGKIISDGPTQILQGEPKELGGHARDRYVYATCSGIFHTNFQPGDVVEQSQEIASIDSTPLLAPLSGLLRGITHDEVPVTIKTKVIEVDPRRADAQISGIQIRPALIASGVLRAIQSWEKTYHVD
jgi:xanthine dehydrogenase accessory factor